MIGKKTEGGAGVTPKAAGASPVNQAAARASLFAFALDQGIKLGLTGPTRLMPHLTPEILVVQLPRELTARLLTNALSSGRMTAGNVLEIAPPSVLAQHIDQGLLWSCVVDIATSSGITAKDRSAGDAAKRWLAEVLKKALDERVVTAAALVRHVPPTEWARDAPLTVLAELIRAGLTKGNFDPELVLHHLTPALIAAHMQTALAWNCIVEAITRDLKADSVAPSPLPATATQLAAGMLGVPTGEDPLINHEIVDILDEDMPELPPQRR